MEVEGLCKAAQRAQEVLSKGPVWPGPAEATRLPSRAIARVRDLIKEDWGGRHLEREAPRGGPHR
eukprot:2895238-Lingulodinium_polyedra.AAC.1